MKKILESSSVILLFAIILITVISGCGSESNSNNTDKKIKVTIPFDLSAKALQKLNQIDNSNNFYGPAPSNIRSVRVDAVYPDDSKISNTAEVSGGTYVEVNMEVNEGSNVYFNAYAYDAAAGAGNLLYTGSSSPQTLVMGMYYEIIIFMIAGTGGATGGNDTTPPTISSVTPSGTNVPTSSIITIIFSEIVYFNDTAAFSTPDIIGCGARGTLSGTTITCSPTSPLSPNTTYTITIPATAIKDLAGNLMTNTYSWSFTTGADGGGGGGGGGGTSLPSVFHFSLPSNNETVLSLTPTLSWTASVGATSYTIDIATNSIFTTIVHSKTEITEINYTVPTAVLSPSTDYWWSVKAINSYGATTVSYAPFKFTTTGQ